MLEILKENIQIKNDYVLKKSNKIENFENLTKDNYIKGIFNEFLVTYPTPSNINYLWNFGVLAGLCLGVQLVTGIILAMHYVPHVDLAFNSIEHIMRDVNNGWLLRYIHANGASMFFIVVYIHMFKAVYYMSYIGRKFPWIVGVVILLLMILTAFMGYVLPWGQMSYWAATVITNLVSAVPLVNDEVLYWIWGGFSVSNATLKKFFSLHYLLPFVIAALAVIHLMVLHNYHGNNPLITKSNLDDVPFYPYFHVKDLFGILVFFIFFSYFIFFDPNVLGHPDNYIPANPLVTPAHIVPEWYFLPFYAILRSIPDKAVGVAAMILAIKILIYLSLKKESIVKYTPPSIDIRFKYLFWAFFFTCLILGWIGGKPPEAPYILIGQCATGFYFLYFHLVDFLITQYKYVK